MKKKAGSYKIYILTGLLIFAVCFLTGCAEQLEGRLEEQFTVPKKVTIEKKETVSPTPEPTPTPEPDRPDIELVPSPEEQAAAIEEKIAELQKKEYEQMIESLPEGTILPEGVTEEEAAKASEARKAKAIETANDLLDHGYYSKESLINAIMAKGFTYEEAKYGAENSYVDWGY